MPHNTSLAADRAKRIPICSLTLRVGHGSSKSPENARLGESSYGILTLVVLLACLASTPAIAAEKAFGSITARLDQAADVTAVTALNRQSGKSFVGIVDVKGKKITVPALPIDATYDLLIETKEQLLEGINLTVPRSDFEEEQPLAKEDVAIIREKVFGLNQFEDQVEILAIEGNIQHAAILLNKVRTKPFVNSLPGEVVWRAELWHYQRPEETWLKAQDELFIVLHRERLQRGVFEKRSVTFDPALGGIRLTEAEPKRDLGRIELPEAKPGIRLRKKGERGASAP